MSTGIARTIAVVLVAAFCGLVAAVLAVVLECDAEKVARWFWSVAGAVATFGALQFWVKVNDKT